MTTTVRVSSETAERIAALRRERGESSDAVVREALDALYWSRMLAAAQRMSPGHRAEYVSEAALWERAATADAAQADTA